MSAWVRLWEKMTGTPHKHENARKVIAAADELSAGIRSLSDRLRPYQEADDPLVALMTDLFEQRRQGARDARTNPN